jgi:hypothetical protein
MATRNHRGRGHGLYHDPGSSARANVYRVPLLAGCPGREPAKGFFTLSAQSVKHHKMLLSEARHPEAYWRIPQETILDCVYDRCCRCSAVARESPGVGKCARKFLRPVRALTCIRFPLCLVRSRGIFRACGLRCRASHPVDCWRSVSNSLGSETSTTGNGRGVQGLGALWVFNGQRLGERSKSMAIR